MTKSSPFDMVHVSTHEIPALFKMQGREEFAPHTNIPMFKTLEKALRNGDATRRVLDYHDQNMKSGRGHDLIRDRMNVIRQAQKMMPYGRHGDNTVALMGKHTENLFDHLLGANHGYPPTNINPHTGKKEYWGLGKFFDGITHGIGNFVNKIPVIGHMVHSIGSGLGNMVGYHNSAGVAQDQQQAQQQQQQQQDPSQQQGGYQQDPSQQQQGYQQQDPSQQQQGGGGFSDMLRNAGNMYDQYQQGGMSGMANNFMNQMGQSQDPYMQAAHNIMQGYNQGGMQGAMDQGMQHVMNMGGGGGGGGGGGMPSFMQPYMQQGQQMYNQMQPYIGAGQQMYNMYNQMQQGGGGHGGGGGGGFGHMLRGAGDMYDQYQGGGGGGQGDSGYGGSMPPMGRQDQQQAQTYGW